MVHLVTYNWAKSTYKQATTFWTEGNREGAKGWQESWAHKMEVGKKEGEGAEILEPSIGSMSCFVDPRSPCQSLLLINKI